MTVAPTDPVAGRLCPGCGYDLRGLTPVKDATARCPECGLALDAAADLTVTLPWAHRRSIGRPRAYLRTVRLSCFGPKRLAANIAAPVSWADAVAFRRVTVAVAVVPALLLATILVFLPDGPLAPAVRHPAAWWAELLAVPVVWVGTWLTVLAAAGVGSYWFHPRSIPVVQQNRAVALSLYGCGPLAIVPAMTAVVIVIALIAPDDNRGPRAAVAMACGWAVLAVGLFVLACWWWTTIGLLRHTTHCGFARQLSLAVGLPVAWAVLAAVFGYGLPLAFLWLTIVVKSL